MVDSENKEIVTIYVCMRNNVQMCQFSQVFEHEIVQLQIPSASSLEISAQHFIKSQDLFT